MTARQNSHISLVNAWMGQAASGTPPSRLVHVFEQGFGAVWRRANRTLGDVTLTAIAERVLYNAAERYPILSALKVESAGLRCEALLEAAGGLRHEDLAEGLRYVLVEFLTVLGNLTAEILTPVLHAELGKGLSGSDGENGKETAS
jgi:hypothetical protein